MPHVPPYRVAVVDDDQELRLALCSLLRATSYQVEDYGSAEDFLSGSARDPDCLIVDVSMPGRSGPELVDVLREQGRTVPAVYISALDPRVLGGRGPLLRKPFDEEQLLSTVHAECERGNRDASDLKAPARTDISAPLSGAHQGMEKESMMNANPLRAVEDMPAPQPASGAARRGFDRIVGSDAGLAVTVQRGQLLRRWHAPLLLQGETGVGKELFAQALHEAAQDASEIKGAFVALHCGGLTPELLARELLGYVAGAFPGAAEGGMIGKLEQASGGTLFVDEIDELPLDLQSTLLRVLENGEFYPVGSSEPRRVDLRWVVASRSDLREATQRGRFRSDLFFRLAATSLTLPPLRERGEDLLRLVEHFAAGVALRSGQPVKSFAPEVLSAFRRYDWPGNVRELRSVVETLCLLSEGSVIEEEMLPSELRPRSSVTSLLPLASSESGELPRGLQAVERAAIQDALRVYSGNLTRVAQELQIARSTLYLKLKKYELDSVLSELRFARA